MICRECDWKIPSDGSECPRCGWAVPQDNRVQGWNSTLKADPRNGLSRSSPSPRRSKGSGLRDAMMEKGRQHLSESPEPLRCENCGMKLPELRFSNISHNAKRSIRPDLREDLDNMTVICSAQNFFGRKDESCHSVWEANDHERYRELEGSRRGEVGT